MGTVAVSATVGVVTGILAWLLLYKVFAPRLKWDNVVTRHDRGPDHPGPLALRDALDERRSLPGRGP
jgi:hypothetical protein